MHITHLRPPQADDRLLLDLAEHREERRAHAVAVQGVLAGLKWKKSNAVCLIILQIVIKLNLNFCYFRTCASSSDWSAMVMIWSRMEEMSAAEPAAAGGGAGAAGYRIFFKKKTLTNIFSLKLFPS